MNTSCKESQGLSLCSYHFVAFFKENTTFLYSANTLSLKTLAEVLENYSPSNTCPAPILPQY